MPGYPLLEVGTTPHYNEQVTGAPGGGRHLNENTGGEEAGGGERDARAGKVAEDMELGRGNLGGGGEGGDHSHK